MFALMAIGATAQAWAGVQPPHTLKATAAYDKVNLAWQAPTAAKELKWHSGRDYDGDNATSTDPQKAVLTYVSSLFTAADLTDNIGDKIEAISVFHYRPVASAKVWVERDGQKVAEGTCDMSKYVKNSWERVALSAPVTIEAGHDYRMVVMFEHGSNADFVAIKDEHSDAAGRGDLFSTDGKNWVATNNGEYLITANLANDADTEAASYNVLVDGAVKATVTDTEYTVEDITGTHTHAVEAVDANGTKAATNPRTLTTTAYDAYLPAVNIAKASVSDFNVGLSWTAPLAGGNSLTWGSGTAANSIGGTASSNTKVWVRNLFSASDLHAFGSNAKITAINMHFAESVMSGITLWVMKDNVLVYSQAVSAEAVAAIKANEWSTFTLDEPFALEPGHDYAYGLYVLHTPKAHPISCDNGAAVEVKGNSFSTSSPNSTNFLKSKPSWKTLGQGNLPGNWMLSATLEGASSNAGSFTYDVTRNGETIATGMSATELKDVVPAPGKYTYTVTTRQADRASMADEVSLNVALPAAYSAPLVSDATFDKSTKEFNMAWSMDKELTHCGTPTYIVGFDEEMPMMWGQQFSADELQAYKGAKIHTLKVAIGAAVKDLRIGVFTAKGQALSVVNIADGELEPMAMYDVKLDTPVEIDGTQDLIMAYDATIPAGNNAIILDEGPVVNGGARVSLTAGRSWINLGTVNSTYNNYNIYIAGVVTPAEQGKQSIARQGNLGNVVSRSSVKAERTLGVDSKFESKAPAKAPAAPTALSFNVYRNGELAANTTAKTFGESVKRFGQMQYYVTAVYENGWESPKSKVITFSNTIAQKAVAPYGLEGAPDEEGLTLTWQSPASATRLSYISKNERSGLGLTKTSGTVDSYAAIKFSADQLKEHVGKQIDHVSFGLLSTDLNSLSVVVLKGENIVYSQSVPVSTLVVGDNDVRLNEPVEILPGTDYAVGYYSNYATGVRPLGTDNSPAVSGFGDLVSSSGNMGYWYSLKTKFKIDQNWWITAILKTADVEHPAKAAAQNQLTYNVYCDGMATATGVTGTTYRVNGTDYKDGHVYHVTAVDGEEESGESNYYSTRSSGVTDITADDAANDTAAEYYNLQGMKLNREALTPGLYIRRSGNNAAKVLVK